MSSCNNHVYQLDVKVEFNVFKTQNFPNIGPNEALVTAVWAFAFPWQKPTPAIAKMRNQVFVFRPVGGAGNPIAESIGGTFRNIPNGLATTPSLLASKRMESICWMIIATFRGVSRIEIAKRTWEEIREDDVFGRAAQLAYYFFLALFPFLICVIATLSVFGTADRGRVLLGALFTRILPGTAYQLIDKTFAEIIQSSGPLKMSLGLVASLWSASMGMSAVMDTLNSAYKVKETRSLIKQYTTAMGITLGLTLLAVASVLTVIFGNQVVGSLSPHHIIAVVWTIIRWAFALAVLLLALAITYYFAPNMKDRKWHWVTPGSLAGVVLLMAVSIGLRAYVHYSGSNSAVYGSLGAVIVLLLCFYLGGVAILSGGAFNGALESLTVPKRVGPSQK